jgi:hypothetical protein
MKNIHILPTEESTLWFYKGIKDFLLTGLTVNKSTSIDPRHIYITSDEEIKKDEYYLGDDNHIYNLVTSVNNNGKKIILTTNQDLIYDGVQVIDDEFLKWFVKNPTCEHVDVYKNWNYPLDKSWEYEIIIPQEEPKQVICRDKFDRVIQNGYYVDVQDSGIHKVYRKEDGQLYFKPYGEEERVSSYFSNDLILISYGTKLIMDLKKEITDKKQEGSKQESYICPHTKIQCDDEFCVSAEDCHIKSSLASGIVDCKTEQETLEDREKRAEELLKAYKSIFVDCSENYKAKRGFIEGANWQAERMYSEEDMTKAFEAGHDSARLRCSYKSNGTYQEDLIKWIKEFKKK